MRVCCVDAKELEEIFPEGSIDRIYLNFSDPWPKARHEKRRLTYRTFLAIYKKILKKDGAIHFKTDNRGLFDFSLEEFKEFGMRMEKLTFDLHNSEYMDGNVMTEYEKRFSSMGVPIIGWSVISTKCKCRIRSSECGMSFAFCKGQYNKYRKKR